jgi:multicomponent K+:H+ antiporter subunit A
VLILLGLRWLPRREAMLPSAPRTTRMRLRRARDLAIAIAAGGGCAALAYAVMTRPFPRSLAPYFLSRSLPEGGGANVVNVLLVDFRGFDTLGEITVLGIVGVIVYALLRRFRPAPESIATPAQQLGQPVASADAARPGADAESGYLLVPSVYLRLLFPVMTMISIYVFLRGHNAPGGGFVAGLIMAVAIILQYVAGGTVWVEANLKLYPRRLIALGLLTAAGTGLGAWAAGYPFLTSHSPRYELRLLAPLLDEVTLPSAFLFDLGVYLLVVGTTAVILLALAHQSVRSHRAAAQIAARKPNQPNQSDQTDAAATSAWLVRAFHANPHTGR